MLTLNKLLLQFMRFALTIFVLLTTFWSCSEDEVLLVDEDQQIWYDTGELPLDENNPENLNSLLDYLNREQYGSWPLTQMGDSATPPIWVYDTTNKGSLWVDFNDSALKTFFPRMYKDSKTGSYLDWVDYKNSTDSLRWNR